MSFLDSLENNLKALENRTEKDPAEARRRNTERERAVNLAPWADELRASPYTQGLLEQAAVAGHKLRGKVYVAWLGTTLRLEFKGRKLELRPTGTGIEAAFLAEGSVDPEKTQPVDLSGDPKALLAEWLGV